MCDIAHLGVVTHISALDNDFIIFIIEGDLQDVEVSVIEANWGDFDIFLELVSLDGGRISLAPLSGTAAIWEEEFYRLQGWGLEFVVDRGPLDLLDS